MTMFYVNYLVLLMLLICGSASSENEGIACTALENVPGACIALRDCRILADKIRQDPRNAILIRDIRRTSEVCPSYSPAHVCCPGVVAQLPRTAVRPVTTPYSENLDGVTPGLKLPTFEDGCGVLLKSVSLQNDIGVRPPSIGTWPWMALLGYETSSGVTFNCGGSIITKRHVLTAAYCLRNDLVLVRFGEYDLNNDTETMHVDINVLKAVRHSDFNKDVNAGRNDIAILYMEQDIPFTDLIKPICLLADDNNYVSNRALVAGWGRTSNRSSEISSVLQHGLIRVYPNDICENIYRMSGNITQYENIDEAFICGGSLEGGVDVCEGDTGGPLVGVQNVNGRQFHFIQNGIISSRVACGIPGTLSLFTKTAYYLDWIKQKITEPF